MSEFNDIVEKLNKLRPKIGDDAVNDLIAKLQSNLQSQQQDASEGAVIIDSPQIIIQGNQVSDRANIRRRQALQSYLRRTRSECNVLPLGQIDPTDADRAQTVELLRLYIGLNTTTYEESDIDEEMQKTGEFIDAQTDSEHKKRPISAIETLINNNNLKEDRYSVDGVDYNLNYQEKLDRKISERERSIDASFYDDHQHRIVQDSGRIMYDALIKEVRQYKANNNRNDDEKREIHESRRIMLLGVPGSGKSTFINHLALCLAGASLAKIDNDIPNQERWIGHLGDWNLGALFPVRDSKRINHPKT